MEAIKPGGMLKAEESSVGRVKGEEDADRGAVPAGFATALDVDPSPMPFDKVLCDEKPDSRSNRGPGGEESIEDPGQILRCNSDSVICDRQDNAGIRACGIANGNGESSTGRRGVD